MLCIFLQSDGESEELAKWKYLDVGKRKVYEQTVHHSGKPTVYTHSSIRHISRKIISKLKRATEPNQFSCYAASNNVALNAQKTTNRYPATVLLLADLLINEYCENYDKIPRVLQHYTGVLWCYVYSNLALYALIYTRESGSPNQLTQIPQFVIAIVLLLFFSLSIESLIQIFIKLS